MSSESEESIYERVARLEDEVAALKNEIDVIKGAIRNKIARHEIDKIKSGKDIPIEERKPEELTELFFKRPIAPRGIKVFNPAFDITPNALISAIITDKGIIKPPYNKNIKKILGKPR